MMAIDAEETTSKPLAVLQGLGLTRADGKAGIRSILTELEAREPGAALQTASRIQLEQLGLSTRG